MTVLSIDLETYSDVDLIKSGVYPYAASPSFEILLLAYAYDNDPVQIIDLAMGEPIPGKLLNDLTSPRFIKAAFNANFERTCLAAYLARPMPPAQWDCTAVRSRQLGLPGYLAGVAQALKLTEQKAAGATLINYFSKPCRPTRTNGGRTRNLPQDDPDRWQIFKDYCRQDVEVERAIRLALNKYDAQPEFERRLWCLDQEINDRGVRVDPGLVDNAIAIDSKHQKLLKDEAMLITGLDNPNSVSQLKQWLSTKGVKLEKLSKANVRNLLEKGECDLATRRVLELRLKMSKASIKKYQAMERAMCPDGRIRGLLQFHGASTGRWAGRLVQVQNLPRNYLPDLDLARGLLHTGDHELLELLFGNVPDTLSQLIRTALIPEEGHRFIISDFSAIEARVIAWLAGEQWRLEVFQSHGKIYEASASQMFKVPLAEITRDHPLRQKGKIAELALGYQGSVGALEQMGATQMGIPPEELPELVSTWRSSNPAIVQFWGDVQDAAIEAVAGQKVVILQQGLKFIGQGGYLFIQLPSGRKLAYVEPLVELDKCYSRQTLSYMGYEQGRWRRLRTYGGRLAENITQAVARDCLAEALLNIAAAGYKIVFHVHDEVVVEAPWGFGSLKEVNRIMSRPIAWAPGLPLRAAGFKSDYYMKD